MHLEITDSGIIGVQLVPMGGGKLFPWLLKPDGSILHMNRLMRKQSPGIIMAVITVI